MASIPTNGYAEVMAGTNNYSGSNSFDGSCPRTPIPPVIGNDLCNKTYVDNAPSAPLTNVAQPTNKTVSYNTGTNILATTTGTSISLFTDETARNSALTSPFLGQFCFLTGSSRLQFYNTAFGAGDNGWNTYPTLLQNELTISGNFTLNVTYFFSYQDKNGVTIPSPKLDGFTVYVFASVATAIGSYTPKYNTTLSALIVGGGGAGGAMYASSFSNKGNGGGGGGGGVTQSSSFTISQGTTYAITVGGGGFRFLTSAGGNGFNSELETNQGFNVAIGGGGGGVSGGGTGGENGGNGGSGGGGAANLSGTSTSGGGYVVGQGTNGAGGAGVSIPAGRGGGAGSNGASGANGVVSSISGSAVFYGGGGGGGTDTNVGGQQLGGNGGGNGGTSASISSGDGQDGTASIGAGGGGGGGQSLVSSSGSNYGGRGGAGVVFIKIPSFV